MRQLHLEKDYSDFKPVKLRLKKWPCVISCGWDGKYSYVTQIINNNDIRIYTFVLLGNSLKVVSVLNELERISGVSPRGVMIKSMNHGIVVSEIEL